MSRTPLQALSALRAACSAVLLQAQSVCNPSCTGLHYCCTRCLYGFTIVLSPLKSALLCAASGRTQQTVSTGHGQHATTRHLSLAANGRGNLSLQIGTLLRVKACVFFGTTSQSYFADSRHIGALPNRLVPFLAHIRQSAVARVVWPTCKANGVACAKVRFDILKATACSRSCEWRLGAGGARSVGAE